MIGTGAGGVLDAIGDTPLIALRKMFAHHRFTVMAKLETFNPGGSMKDRPALNMVFSGIRDGTIKPGQTVIVESSSGNLGIGLAQVCAYFGIRFICVVDGRTTRQNISILRAYGAEVDVVSRPALATGEYLPARLARARELAATVPHAQWINQYSNPRNPEAHHQTAREIVELLDGEVDFIFCATGSCGTLRGCAEYLKSQELSTRLVAVDAIGSVIFGGPSGPRLIPGHGASVSPAHWSAELSDEVVLVSDLDCVVGCRRLARQEALLLGGSSGGIVSAVERMSARISQGARCVLILPDRGDRYLDTIYNDEWVLDNLGDVSRLWEEVEREVTRA
ncbi:2,3-diaminopropionate biosynthesis protein SbnA [Streptomyces sp. NPDC051218]|uniref:2,3-diaminopropionate biosynthesis protein SbnA n=1 Tax=Streptomyces sp. NPDC051218 TaxID=3365645 RepID=UPI0037AE45DC